MNLSQLTQRQKILAGILVGTVVLMLGLPALWDVVFGPFNRRYTDLAALNERLDQKQRAKDKLDTADMRLKISDRRSLPSDPSSLAYQVWLTDLTKKHEFKSVGVSPKPATRNGNEPFSRIRFAITAQCQMKDLCRFLYDFYRTDLLHKVINISLKSLDHKTDPEFDVSIDIEGLSMRTTKKRDTLFEDKQEQAVNKAWSKIEFSEYESLYAKNRFARGYNGPPKPATPPPPPTPPFDSSPYVKYVGFVEVDGIPEGWLYDQTANKQTILKSGVDFEVAGTKATVVEVNPDFLTFKVRDKTWRIEQGESLKQMRELGTDGKPVIAATTTPGATSQQPAGSEPAKAEPSVSTNPTGAQKEATTTEQPEKKGSGS